jgi:SNF2 family DNA or RNA helicase
VISETKTYDKPVETGGGILADDMGLGKTLTMLANLVATLNDAATFQVSSTSTVEGHLTDEETLCRSRATLVLVPSHSEFEKILKLRTIEDGINVRCYVSAH